MNEIVKDAPCLCKEYTETSAAVKRNFFQQIQYYWFLQRKSRYQYPVAYSDGTVSDMECECVGRRVLGFMDGATLISCEAKVLEREMSSYKEEQCWNDVLREAIECLASIRDYLKKRQ